MKYSHRELREMGDARYVVMLQNMLGAPLGIWICEDYEAVRTMICATIIDYADNHSEMFMRAPALVRAAAVTAGTDDEINTARDLLKEAAGYVFDVSYYDTWSVRDNIDIMKEAASE